MPTSKNSNRRQARILSDKPAAVKLREERKRRTPEERLVEKIHSQRRAATRLARDILNRSAWNLLGHAEQKLIVTAVEAGIRDAYEMAIEVYNDKLSVCYEARKAITNVFAHNAKLFVCNTEFGEMDKSLPSELFDIEWNDVSI